MNTTDQITYNQISKTAKNRSKKKPKGYLLLLSAQADATQTEDENSRIKSKTNKTTFEVIYEEFIKDDVDVSLLKDWAFHIRIKIQPYGTFSA